MYLLDNTLLLVTSYLDLIIELPLYLITLPVTLTINYHTFTLDTFISYLMYDYYSITLVTSCIWLIYPLLLSYHCYLD